MGDPLRILVADDDDDVLQDVSSSLEALGACVTARSGDELIARLGEDAPFDVVVTDIAMPWMTGLQVMHATRYAGLPTPVIVMTGLRDAEIPDRVRALGEHAYLLRKPFGMAQLERALAAVLPGYARWRAVS